VKISWVDCRVFTFCGNIANCNVRSVFFLLTDKFFSMCCNKDVDKCSMEDEAPFSFFIIAALLLARVLNMEFEDFCQVGD
jgi:hypothetical protein